MLWSKHRKRSHLMPILLWTSFYKTRTVFTVCFQQTSSYKVLLKHASRQNCSERTFLEGVAGGKKGEGRNTMNFMNEDNVADFLSHSLPTLSSLCSGEVAEVVVYRMKVTARERGANSSYILATFSMKYLSHYPYFWLWRLNSDAVWRSDRCAPKPWKDELRQKE